MFSELERDVLEAIILGKRKVDQISKFCGIPEFTVNEIVKRLIEKGYLSEDMSPTVKAYRDLKWIDRKRPPSFYGENLVRFFKMILDIIIILIILFLIKNAVLS